MNALDYGVVFLDVELRVRRHNDAAALALELGGNSFGAWFGDLDRVDDSALAAAKLVISDGAPVERFAEAGRWQFQPCRSGGEITGCLLIMLASDPGADTVDAVNREQFLSTLSHELRNPLMALLTAAECIEENVDMVEIASAVAVIRRQTDKMARVLEELIDAPGRVGRVGIVGPRSADRPIAARRVLLVEDQQDNREMLAMALERVGYDVITAASVEEARLALAAENIDAAVIDIGLPDGTGHEIARAARKRAGGDLFLIALTGHGLQVDHDNIMAAGFDVHLVKPITIATLREALKETD